MKNKILTSTLFLLIILLINSCTKVIDINLNAVDPKIVVEANISDVPHTCFIKLTKTVNFNETNTFPPVSGAAIKITDNLGNVFHLTETILGEYTCDSLQTVPGRTYFLTIASEGKTYTASSTVPNLVGINALLVDSEMGFRGGEYHKFIKVQYQDPSGINNYYSFIVIINGHLNNNIFINDDKLQDGNLTNYRIREQINSGDNVTVWMQSIDKNVFDYFSTLQQLLGNDSRGGQSATPANPLTNINGGALGYFSANSETSKTIIVQ